ncbi:hypothetical protein BDZ97DRAFT_1849167 [Flammula alnicola]|nr:hypothetical protein BDZ97DRAFT_1849167 [Flammula alnicola]
MVRGKRHGGRKRKSPYLQHNSYDEPHPLPTIAAASTSAYASQHSIVYKRPFSASQSSLRASAQQLQGSPMGTSNMPTRTTRLSNVEGHTDDQPLSILRQPSQPSNPTARPSSSPSSKTPNMDMKAGSVVRSMPPTSVLPDPKLTMTPDNIRPLLER